MKPLRQLLMIFRMFTGEILLSLLLGIAAIGAGIGLLGTSAYIIASAALHPSIAVLQVAIVGVRFFGISRGVFRYLERYVSHSVNLRVVSRLREDFMRRVEPGAPANLVTRQGGDILQTVMGDLQVLENFYVRVIAPVVVALVIIAGTSLFLGVYAVELGVILLLGMLVTGFLQPAIALVLTRWPSRRLADANAHASAKLVEILQGFEDIQATNTQNLFFEQLTGSFAQAGSQQNNLSLTSAVNSGVSLFLSNLTLLIALWTAIPLVNENAISGVSLAVITLVVLAAFEAVTPLNAAAQTYNAGVSAADRLYSVGEPDMRLHPSNKPIPAGLMQQIRFAEVGLSFDQKGETILQGINFELRTGRRTAIVGASGVGKTSLINLLMGFNHPSTGTIQLNGMDYHEFEPDSVRSFFSVLPQTIHLFNDDVRQNLLVANPIASEEQLRAAISQSGLQAWVDSQPDGLDTWIGERGVKMSGGERQRLAIARLFLQDRPYLLLDEPTTHLDRATAADVMTNLLNWAADKGMLFISHDLYWLPQVDEIILIEEGRIVERGSFAELMAMRGCFARFFEAENDRLPES